MYAAALGGLAYALVCGRYAATAAGTGLLCVER